MPDLVTIYLQVQGTDFSPGGGTHTTSDPGRGAGGWWEQHPGELWTSVMVPVLKDYFSVCCTRTLFG